MTVLLDKKKKKGIWKLSWFTFLFKEWNYSGWIYPSDASRVLSYMKGEIFAI